MSRNVALLAEAGPQIGTGHFVETLFLASACKAAGMEPLVVANSEVPEGLLARVQGERWIIPGFGPAPLRELAGELAGRDIRLVVTNLRSITNDQVGVLTEAGMRVVCIDEWGKRRLDCDAVVNPTPVVAQHHYLSNRPGFRVYAGPRYLSLSPEYARQHRQARRYTGGIRSVVVSMGGVDRTGATLKIIEILAEFQGEFETVMLLGAGFPWHERMEKFLRSALGRWKVLRNVAGPADVFAAADVAFTAGGNTLYELACVGTPAIVMYEDPHEGEQGRTFEAQGFGLCLGRGIEAVPEAIRQAIDRLEDPEFRRRQGEAGKRLLDGQGASRVFDILKEQLTVDSPVSA